MPIINGEEVLNVTAAQLDELLFNINFGSISYAALQPTDHILLSAQTLNASSEISSPGVATGNNAKMFVTFAQTGSSTNCTMYLYGSDFEDLSMAGIFAMLTLGTGEDPVKIGIAPHYIPAYTYCKCINNDTSNSAICTVTLQTWTV